MEEGLERLALGREVGPVDQVGVEEARPVVDGALEVLERGLADEKAGRTYEDLTAERDRLLIAYLKAQLEVREG